MPRYETIHEYETALAGDGLTVGIVMSRFNPDIGEGLLSACTTELRRLGVAASNIEIATVPGALEIPLALQTMAQSDRYDALIALGAVIRGETYHFEVVSNESARGIMALTLDGLAIGNGILTVENDDQAWAYHTLPALLASTQGDSAKQAQLGRLLGTSPEAAGAGLASAARATGPDGAALTMSSLNTMNAIGARTMYLSTGASAVAGGASPARATEDVTTQSSLIPIDLGPTTSGWLKFSNTCSCSPACSWSTCTSLTC